MLYVCISFEICLILYVNYSNNGTTILISWYLRNGESYNPGILHHPVTFYYKINICDKFSIFNLPQSPDIGQNWDGGISDFRISGQSFINENCHNYRTSHDIYMKLGTVTKLSRETQQRQKTLTMTSCRQIVTWLYFFRFIVNL